MGKTQARETVSRREVLKLAGTAAAFCTSFGFLQAADGSGQVADHDHKLEGKDQLSARWQQAEIKFYKGSTLLHSSPIPSVVMKHLQSDEMAVVQIKLFRAGSFLMNLGTIEAKH